MRTQAIASLAVLALVGCEAKPADTRAARSALVAASPPPRSAPGFEAAKLDGLTVDRTFDTRDGRALLGALPPMPKDSDLGPTPYVLLERTAEGTRQLATRVGLARYAPDGAVVFTEGRTLVELRGTTRHVLLDGVDGEWAFSPDGGRLAVVRAESRLETRIDLVARDGSASARPLVKAGATTGMPAFSPDGRTLVFVAARAGLVALYRTDLESGVEAQVTNAHATVGSPDFVPVPGDYTSLRFRDARTVEYDAGGGHRWVVDLETGKGEEVAR